MSNFSIYFFLVASFIGFFTVIDTRHHHHHHSKKHHPKHEWQFSSEEHQRKNHQPQRSRHIEGRYATRTRTVKAGPQKIQSLEEFRTEGLKIHNQLREKHGSPPLELDDALCKLAVEWAEEIGEGSDAMRKIVLAHTPEMTTYGGVGDNIFAKVGNKDVTAEFATNWWYDEIKYMNWSDNQYYWRTGHFTQLIWKDSKKFGIAKYKTPEMGFSIVVATYSPRGNMKYKKAFADNVLPPLNAG